MGILLGCDGLTQGAQLDIECNDLQDAGSLCVLLRYFGHNASVALQSIAETWSSVTRTCEPTLQC